MRQISRMTINHSDPLGFYLIKRSEVMICHSFIHLIVVLTRKFLIIFFHMIYTIIHGKFLTRSRDLNTADDRIVKMLRVIDTDCYVLTPENIFAVLSFRLRDKIEIKIFVCVVVQITHTQFTAVRCCQREYLISF